jgi:hypothetical protein
LPRTKPSLLPLLPFAYDCPLGTSWLPFSCASLQPVSSNRGDATSP